ncbi:MAG: glycosyltransferase family 39 protein [Nibricoccus sp.]
MRDPSFPQKSESTGNPAPRAPKKKFNLLCLVAAVLTLALVITVRIRLASTPLERDEGEYAYIGQLILQGIPPYREAANMKFPGTYVGYAVIEAVFGQTTSGIHYGLLVLNIATAYLIYLFGKRIFSDETIAIAAAIIYATSSLSFSFLGPMAHATHFVVFWGILGLVVLGSALKRKSTPLLIVAGVFSGFAYLSKQSGFYFFLFGIVYALLEHCAWRSPRKFLRTALYFTIGAFAPFALTVVVLRSLGCLDTFVFWTFQYASHYSSTISQAGSTIGRNIRSLYLDGYGWIFVAPALLLFLFPRAKQLAQSYRLPLIGSFLAFSLAGVCLGLICRAHYWIQLLPATALAAAAFFHKLSALVCNRFQTHIHQRATLLICICFCAIMVSGEAKQFFKMSSEEIIQEIYHGNPFNETVKVADYIERHSQKNDKIFVFGSDPEIYFYSKRRSVTNFIYLYPLLENQPYATLMQRTLILDLEANNPRYFVEVHLNELQPDAEQLHPLYLWKSHFLSTYYRPVFMVDRYSGNNYMIRYDAVLKYKSREGNYIALWELKAANKSAN